MLDMFFIICAKYLISLPILIAVGYTLSLPRDIQKRIVIFGTIAFPLMLLVAFGLGHVYDDPRPFVVGHFIPLIPHDPDNGFPSDHVLLVSAIAAVITVFHRRLGVLLWVIAFIIALSRVYVGVHHPIDVVGSMIIAIAVMFVTVLVIRRFGRPL
jgi:undecaprenyl-diphosphatase